MFVETTKRQPIKEGTQTMDFEKKVRSLAKKFSKEKSALYYNTLTKSNLKVSKAHYETSAREEFYFMVLLEMIEMYGQQYFLKFADKQFDRLGEDEFTTDPFAADPDKTEQHKSEQPEDFDDSDIEDEELEN